jgi:hypothetical protein
LDTAFATDFWRSESDQEAKQSREKLQNLVEQLLQSNQDISRRLKNFDAVSGSRSTLTQCLNGKGPINAGQDGEQIATVVRRLGSDERSCGGIIIQTNAVRFTFEDELRASRVYRRTQPYSSDASFTTSSVRTHAWSIFSGFSLADISAVSAIALPLYSHEISNNQWYKFEGYSQADQHATPVQEAPLIPSKKRYTGNESTDPENQTPATRAILPRQSFSPISAAVEKRIFKEHKHVDPPAHCFPGPISDDLVSDTSIELSATL